MAGFRIEFSGSAVEKKDQPEVTTTSSLTALVPVAGVPASMNGDAVVTFQIDNPNIWPDNQYSNSPYPGPLNYVMNHNNANMASSFTSGGVTGLNPSSSGHYVTVLVTPVFTNGATVNLRLRVSNGDGGVYLYHSGLAGAASGTYFNLNGTGGVTFYTTSYSVPAGQYFMMQYSNGGFYNGNNYGLSWDYISFTEPTSVSITESTNQAGVDATGGTAVTTDVTTVQAGTGASSGTSKEFGLEVIHDSNKILNPTYYAPSDSTQSATASLTQTKIIEATAETISVEAIGLTGPEKIRSQKTSLIVENYNETEEN